MYRRPVVPAFVGVGQFGVVLDNLSGLCKFGLPAYHTRAPAPRGAVAMAITIIGIPLAVANLKMIPISLMPLGKDIIDAPQ